MKEQVTSVLSQITSIKLIHHGAVSKITKTAQSDLDAESGISDTPDLNKTLPISSNITSNFLTNLPKHTISTCSCQTQTINVVTGLIPSTIAPRSGAVPHIHSFVCNSATCTRDTTTNTQNLAPTSQPTIIPQSEMPSSLQVQFDRETSPLTYSNTNSNLVSREEETLQKQNQGFAPSLPKLHSPKIQREN